MLKNIAPKARPRTKTAARRLRQEMPLPEIILRHSLRQRPGGLKFRRQHPTGPYVLDFFCNDARLAIEIDGEAHNFGNRPQRDMARDDWLRAAGVETLRIPAKALTEDADDVLRWIMSEAIARLPLHHPAAPAGPPPRDKLGEDQG